MRSLRARLTLGVTVVVAAVLLLAGALAARDVDRSEREALDERLVRTAELSGATALRAVQEEVPSADDRLAAVLSATRTSLRLVLGEAPLVETGDPAPRHRRLPKGLSTFESGGVRYRAYVSDLRDKSLGGLARLELTTRLTQLEDRQERLRERLTLIGLLALILAAVGTFAAGGLVLRPLRRLRATASQIAGEEDLGRRVPVTGGSSETRSLAVSFNAMLMRLSRSAADRERAMEATRRFTADAGHELRTPLTSIQARLDALARHPDEPPERRAAMAAEALDQQRRVVGLLDGLQALARGETAPGLEPTDLADAVDAAIAAARERHPETTFTLDAPEGEVAVEAWEPGLRSIVDNLLDNAARHGQRVRVEVTGARHLPRSGDPVVPGTSPEVGTPAGSVALVVEDDGPGVPEEERGRIFEPFVRLDDDDGGTGLGLAIVAQQARHHGATVRVERSEALGGARFVVRFP